MFKETQIKSALGKVKTGADFPAYIQEMEAIGVTHYETFLNDAHSVYYGKNNFKLTTKPLFETVPIASEVNAAQLRTDIANHQQGKSGYAEIVRQCAGNGIEKWVVSISEMTCTYYDLPGNKVLIEMIPNLKNKANMFTLTQIKEAHSKVKSGADFPAYIQDIKKLGVTYYETFVADGHTDFYGANDYKITSPAKYATLEIAQIPDETQLKTSLKAHQDGQTDYPSFCSQAAASGVDKWAVSLDKMTCTYFDKAGNALLVETIPQ